MALHILNHVLLIALDSLLLEIACLVYFKEVLTALNPFLSMEVSYSPMAAIKFFLPVAVSSNFLSSSAASNRAMLAPIPCNGVILCIASPYKVTGPVFQG